MNPVNKRLSAVLMGLFLFSTTGLLAEQKPMTEGTGMEEMTPMQMEQKQIATEAETAQLEMSAPQELPVAQVDTCKPAPRPCCVKKVKPVCCKPAPRPCCVKKVKPVCCKPAPRPCCVKKVKPVCCKPAPRPCCVKKVKPVCCKPAPRPCCKTTCPCRAQREMVEAPMEMEQR